MKNMTSNVAVKSLDLGLGDLVPTVNTYSRHYIELGNGKVTTGMQKVADRFTVTFLNMVGSTEHDPDFGTGLIAGISIGSSMNFGVLQSNIAVAVSEAEQQIIYDDTDDIYKDSQPDDEKLASAVCDAVEYVPKFGVLKIYVTLTNVAGEEYTYVLPANLLFQA